MTNSNAALLSDALIASANNAGEQRFSQPMMVLGHLPECVSNSPAPASHKHVLLCDYSYLLGLSEAKDLPDLIVAPLFDSVCDGVDVARKLARLHYKGAFCVVSPPVANPKMIVAELQAAAPTLAIELLTLPRRTFVPKTPKPRPAPR